MQTTSAKVLKNKFLTKNVFELTLETEKPFDFKAGQFITIKIADKPLSDYFRAYSICSAIRKNKKKFKLCIKKVENGRGSTWLSEQKKGDMIEFSDPSGNFTFQSKKEKNILLIATGTGVAPLKSIIENELKNKNKQNFYLLIGLRFIKDIFYKRHFTKLQKSHPNFKFDITLSRPEKKSWKGLKGRVTDLLPSLKINSEKTEVYLCGFSEMIEDVTKILNSKNIPKSSIHFEKYN